MTTQLEIQEHSVDDVTVVNLSGSLDGHTYLQLEKILKQHVEQGVNRVVVVLKDISYIASAGVGALISHMKHCRNTGGALEIAEPSSSVTEVLEILGLDSLMTLHRNLEQAIAAAKYSPT